MRYTIAKQLLTCQYTFVYSLLMTQTERRGAVFNFEQADGLKLDRVVGSQKVQCDNCFVWVPKDRIVWRGPDGRLAICDECQEAGDDYR